MMYVVISDDVIQRAIDGAFIPVDGGNRDYQRYLAWVAAGSPDQDITPEPALEALPE